MEYYQIQDTKAFDETRSRLYAATGCEGMAEFAAYLGVRQFVISDARRCLRLPAAWIDTIEEKTGMDLSWLLH